MSASPYREPENSDATVSDRPEAPPEDFDLVAAYAVLWIASVVHLAGALLRREKLGGIDVLAAIVIVLLPLLVVRPARVLVARARRRIKKS